VAEQQGSNLLVAGTPANDTFVFNPGAAPGSLQVTVNGTTAGTFTPPGPVQIYGYGGTNTVTVNGTAAANSFTVYGLSMTMNGFGFTGNSIQGWLVNGGAANNTLTVVSTVGTTPVTFNGGAGVNTLIGPNTTNLWNITAANTGKVGNVTFKGVQNLVGGTGLDTFKFQPAGSVMSIVGGGAPHGQGDWLDYSSFPNSKPVTVNLATGAATGVNGGAAGAVKRIQNVAGGSGNDTLTGDAQGNILIGNGGNDTINGGTGRSLLIGGGGAVTINGGSGGDILIGGKTIYDNTNHTALMIILAEWQSADSYATRIDRINDGIIPGHKGIKLFSGSTVINNPSTTVSTLNAFPSTTDLDWFFASASDILPPLESGEALNNVS
jgi:Ca2+-binding RTX toxin-like protein